MTELDRTWAQTQVEAMADGSLSPTAERRMLALMQADADLRHKVEQARQLRRDLRRLGRGRVPGGLWRRLWQIPAADRPGQAGLIPAIVLASVAVVAIGIAIWTERPEPVPDERAQQAALQDFATAMSYLQKGMLVASNQVNATVSSGMKNAATISREAVEGEQDHDD